MSYSLIFVNIFYQNDYTMRLRHLSMLIPAIFLSSVSCLEKAPEIIESDQDVKQGIEYVYDPSVVPEVDITVTPSEWNSLLAAYDKDKNTKKTIKCDVTYFKGNEVTRIQNAGLRLRGAASRTRPEGSTGQQHKYGVTKWRNFHFQVNFHKFVKDDAHTIHGARKILFRFFSGDAAYVREHYCYDMFRRAGVFTGANCEYCRLCIKIDGDPKSTYFGLYNMVEPIDETFVKVRKEEFGSAEGNLWKCRHHATLAIDSYFDHIGVDNESEAESIYELKTNTDSFDQGKAQLMDFIVNLNKKTGQDFHDWIAKVCDVRLLLRTYAVNVALGMWDDYWCNENNYYIYFNSTDPHDYKFFFIPFDYDHSLGNCATRSGNSDQGRHDPLNWGSTSRPLIWKIIQFEDYRDIYKEELLRLVDEENGLMYWTASRDRITAWQDKISAFVKSDLNPKAVIKDQATGELHTDYKLLEDSPLNFFKVKKESIEKYCR